MINTYPCNFSLHSSVPVLANSGASGKRLTGDAPGPCSAVSESSGSHPGGPTWGAEDVED